jgi:hypothetical protein
MQAEAKFLLAGYLYKYMYPVVVDQWKLQ